MKAAARGAEAHLRCLGAQILHRPTLSSSRIVENRGGSSGISPLAGEFQSTRCKSSCTRAFDTCGILVTTHFVQGRYSSFRPSLLGESGGADRTGETRQAHIAGKAGEARGLSSFASVVVLRTAGSNGLATSAAEKPEADAEKISVTFVDKDGEEKEIKVAVGMSMLEAAHENDIELEGACEGSLACSTCHVIVTDEGLYNKLPEPTDEENDMLDLAFGLTETSRLGCQVIAKPELDGMRLALPAATRNFAVDGHVPKPH